MDRSRALQQCRRARASSYMHSRGGAFSALYAGHTELVAISSTSSIHSLCGRIHGTSPIKQTITTNTFKGQTSTVSGIGDADTSRNGSPWPLRNSISVVPYTPEKGTRNHVSRSPNAPGMHSLLPKQTLDLIQAVHTSAVAMLHARHPHAMTRRVRVPARVAPRPQASLLLVAER